MEVQSTHPIITPLAMDGAGLTLVILGIILVLLFPAMALVGWVLIVLGLLLLVI